MDRKIIEDIKKLQDELKNASKGFLEKDIEIGLYGSEKRSAKSPSNVTCTHPTLILGLLSETL